MSFVGSNFLQHWAFTLLCTYALVATGRAATTAYDTASEPTYDDGWQAGDNGGFGFGPWSFDNFFDPQFSPYPAAEFISANSYVDIPDGGPAFALTNANQPYFGYTSVAIRQFAQPLQVGNTLRIDLDNPILTPLGQFEFPGVIFQLFDGFGNEQLGLLGQAGFNSGNWAIVDADNTVGRDTGLSLGTTAEGGVHYELTLTDADSYQLVLTPYKTGLPLTFSGNLLNPGAVVSELRITMYFNGSSSSGSREFYANNLQILSPDMPDLNMDGVVDIFDVNIVSDHWGESGLPGIAGDANKDGVVDIFDVNVISDNWSQNIAATVPEPASVVLLSATLGLVVAQIRFAWRQQ